MNVARLKVKQSCIESTFRDEHVDVGRYNVVSAAAIVAGVLQAGFLYGETGGGKVCLVHCDRNATAGLVVVDHFIVVKPKDELWWSQAL